MPAEGLAFISIGSKKYGNRIRIHPCIESSQLSFRPWEKNGCRGLQIPDLARISAGHALDVAHRRKYTGLLSFHSPSVESIESNFFQYPYAWIYRAWISAEMARSIEHAITGNNAHDIVPWTPAAHWQRGLSGTIAFGCFGRPPVQDIRPRQKKKDSVVHSNGSTTSMMRAPLSIPRKTNLSKQLATKPRLKKNCGYRGLFGSTWPDCGRIN